jgi:uncharacterized protein (DUF927 family)
VKSYKRWCRNFSTLLELFLNKIGYSRYKLIDVIEKTNKLVINFVELKVWGYHNFRN